MKLKPFYAKQVKIVAENKLVFLGKVNEYFYPSDNESGKESIVIDTAEGKSVEFYETDILSIEIIE